MTLYDIYQAFHQTYNDCSFLITLTGVKIDGRKAINILTYSDSDLGVSFNMDDSDGGDYQVDKTIEDLKQIVINPIKPYDILCGLFEKRDFFIASKI